MNHIAETELVLYLPLYELNGSSFMSRDAYGHLCTVMGSLWRPQGRYFDGVNDKIVVTTAPSLYPAGGLTLECWFYVDPSLEPMDGNVRHFFDMGAGACGFSLFWDDRGGDYGINNVAFGTVGTADHDNLYFVSSTENFLSTAGWYHLTGTWDLAVKRTYLNAKAKATCNFVDTLKSGSSDLYLGMRSNNTVPSLCTLGEVRIYGRALTPQEIQRNYLATKWRYQ